MLKDERTLIYENINKSLKIDLSAIGIKLVEEDSTITIYDGDKKVGILLMIEDFERI